MKTETLTVTVNCKLLEDKAKKVETYAKKLRAAIAEMDEVTAQISFETK